MTCKIPKNLHRPTIAAWREKRMLLQENCIQNGVVIKEIGNFFDRWNPNDNEQLIWIKSWKSTTMFEKMNEILNSMSPD
jgi:hypothetical protein